MVLSTHLRCYGIIVEGKWTFGSKCLQVEWLRVSSDLWTSFQLDFHGERDMRHCRLDPRQDHRRVSLEVAKALMRPPQTLRCMHERVANEHRMQPHVNCDLPHFRLPLVSAFLKSEKLRLASPCNHLVIPQRSPTNHQESATVSRLVTHIACLCLSEARCRFSSRRELRRDRCTKTADKLQPHG